MGEAIFTRPHRCSARRCATARWTIGRAADSASPHAPDTCSSAASSPLGYSATAAHGAAARADARGRAARAQIAPAHARVAPAGDAGVRRAAVPVQHAGRRSSGCTRDAPIRPNDCSTSSSSTCERRCRTCASRRRRSAGARARARLPRHHASPTGRRLEFASKSPPTRRSARMPPMMLLPLIDHAIGVRASAGRAAKARIACVVTAIACGVRADVATAARPSGPTGRGHGHVASIASGCSRSMATTPASSSNGCASAAPARLWNSPMKPPTA